MMSVAFPFFNGLQYKNFWAFSPQPFQTRLPIVCGKRWNKTVRFFPSNYYYYYYYYIEKISFIFLVYTGYAYTHSQGLTGVIITDHEYPQRVAFNVLNLILEEFLLKHPKIRWAAPLAYSSGNSAIGAAAAPTSRDVPFTPFPSLKEYLQKYQHPHEADSILKVQKEIDETKVILHKTIESMLDRGEKLDQLVDKSEKLSAQSKTFYKVAQKTNSCSCSIQ